MRKVLLASTALVALGSVSAMAADVTISGSAEFQYESYSSSAAMSGGTNGTSTDFDQDVNIKFSTVTDTGLTVSMDMGLAEGGAQDDQSLTIAGDFGSISFESGDDGIAGQMDVDAALAADEAQSLITATDNSAFTGSGSASTTGDSITYKLPAMVPGLELGVSYSDSGTTNKSDATEIAARYTMSVDGATIVVAAQSGRIDDNGTAGADTGQAESHYGLSITMGALTFAAEANSVDEDGTSGKTYEGGAYGLSYAVNDSLSVAAHNQSRDKTTGVAEFSQTAVSATYTVAPGLSVSATISDNELGSGSSKTSDDYTVIAINASF